MYQNTIIYWKNISPTTFTIFIYNQNLNIVILIIIFNYFIIVKNK